MALAVGDPAPRFTLSTTQGTLTFDDLAGKKYVIYFYPKDNTPGCTREAIDFSCIADAFVAAGVTLIGVSPDSVASHDKFRAKHDLKLTLGSDETHDTIEAFGVWVEKNMYGRKSMGVERSTFLVGADGRIAGLWRKVKVDGHAEAVLAAARAL